MPEFPVIQAFRESKTPLRLLLRRYGAARTTIAITLLAIVLSVIVSAAINFAMDSHVSSIAILISIAAPAIIAPLFEYRSLSLLNQLDRTEQRLRILSITDDLTGAYNRRHFFELANDEIARIQRDGGTCSMAIMDFDNFKTVNDTYGHIAGDQALVQVSKACMENIRENDVFARYGGDEFVFLFPQTGQPQAKECLERIMSKIAEISIHAEIDIRPKVSIGLYTFSPKINTLDSLLQNADLALYKAKQTGGNRVV